jgi:hypothetical protein
MYSDAVGKVLKDDDISNGNKDSEITEVLEKGS